MQEVIAQLDERKRQILRAVVEEHIRTAEPVGSKTICEEYGLDVSPATVRNELGVLEDLQLIRQPHTSAGRVPSDLGYRVYVEELMTPDPVPEIGMDRLQGICQRGGDVAECLRTACRLLSEVTNYTAFVLMPQVSRDRMRHLQIGQIERRRMLVLLVTTAGHVEHQLFEVDFDLPEARLRRIANYLNAKLRGRTLLEVKNLDVETMAQQDRFFEPDLPRVFGLVRDSISEEIHDRILIEGVVCILSQPEFQDVEKASALLAVFEVPTPMESLLAQLAESEGVEVSIGSELGRHPLDECSIVGAGYGAPAGPAGSIGVLGPRRMKYGRSIPAVEHLASELTEYLQAVAS